MGEAVAGCSMTSVKEFRVDEPATADSLGRGRFVFTDAYSVFDWGQMPDAIPRKGASLCAMGAFNFELLEDEGIPTHYRGVADPGRDVDAGEEGETGIVPLADATAPPTEMAIDLTQVPDLPYEDPEAGYDYDAFHAAGGENYLVPLEVVFRNRSRSGPACGGAPTPPISGSTRTPISTPTSGPTGRSTSPSRSWSSRRSTNSRTAT